MTEQKKPSEYRGFRIVTCLMLTVSYLIVVEHRLEQSTAIPRLFLIVASLVYCAATLIILFVPLDDPPSDDDRHDSHRTP